MGPPGVDHKRSFRNGLIALPADDGPDVVSWMAMVTGHARASPATPWRYSSTMTRQVGGVHVDSIVNQMEIFFINNITVIRLPWRRALTAC
jgi:hypothetical protein